MLRDIDRGGPASRVTVVHELLQRNAHSLVIEQGCAELARRRNSWTHYLPSDPWRIAPPICPDLICGRHSHPRLGVQVEIMVRVFLIFRHQPQLDHWDAELSVRY